MPTQQKTAEDIKYEEFMRDLASVINRYSRENGSNTPDFILAEFLAGCLTVYENTISARTDWFKKG